MGKCARAQRITSKERHSSIVFNRIKIHKKNWARLRDKLQKIRAFQDLEFVRKRQCAHNKLPILTHTASYLRVISISSSKCKRRAALQHRRLAPSFSLRSPGFAPTAAKVGTVTSFSKSFGFPLSVSFHPAPYPFVYHLGSRFRGKDRQARQRPQFQTNMVSPHRSNKR